MDVGTLVLGIYLTVITSVVGWLVIRRLDQVPTREEMNARFDAYDKRFDAYDKRFDGHDSRFDRLDAEIAALRSDLTQIALAVGARPRPQTG